MNLLLFFRAKIKHQTVMRCFSTEKRSLIFLLFFRHENKHLTVMRCFPQRKCWWVSCCCSESKIIIKLWCAVFPQRKICLKFLLLLKVENNYQTIIRCFHRENIDICLTGFQIRKESSNYSALFFHRESFAEFLAGFQSRK